jgi:hypothetical protein
VFALPPVWQRITASLDFILSHPAARRFRFVTPHEALRMLGCLPTPSAECKLANAAA